MPGTTNPLSEAAKRIVAVAEGDVGPSGDYKMTDTCTDGLLLRSLEALEAAVLVCGRSVSGKRQQRYFCWLVRDALGKQIVLEDAVALGTGDRLLKAAKKVRVADLAPRRPFITYIM